MRFHAAGSPTEDKETRLANRARRGQLGKSREWKLPTDKPAIAAAFPDVANLERQSRVPNPARPGKPAPVGNPNSRRRFFSPGGLDAASALKLVDFFHAPDRVILHDRLRSPSRRP